MSSVRQPADIVLALSTVPDADTGSRIAHQLLTERLIACANLLPGLTSLFRWEGVVQNEREVLVLMKTSRSAVAALSKRLIELHPYEVPELITLPVEAGLDAYCRWVSNETIQ